MIRLLYGKDDYRLRRRLREIRASLDPESVQGSNISVLDGAALTPGELLAHASAAPFLAPERLVTVEGLVAALASERRGRKKKDADDPLAAWEAALAQLSSGALPPTTTLIFVEGTVDQRTRAFKLFAGISQVEEFNLLTGREDGAALAEWITRIAEEQGASVAGRVTATVAQLSGGDLWAVETELAKLSAYAAGETIDQEMLATASSFAQETKVWELADGIVAGDERKALGAMRRLIDAGEPPQLLLFMVARQFRQLVIIKDMRERGLSNRDIEAAAGLPSFRVGPVSQIAARYTWATLRACYEGLLEADLNVKRGLVGVEEALQLLVHDLCAEAPQTRTAGMRR